MSTAEISTQVSKPQSAITDLCRAAMALPVEQQQLALAEYAERRKGFRDWLRAQLVEGVHYGVPPGCEPKKDARGWLGIWDKRANSYKWYPPEQWQAKPSLYKAGAEFVVDLMGLRPYYEADNDGWTQLGSKAGTFVYSCELYSKENGELIGEGRGVRAVGQKGGDENNAIKMAMKSALVCAVLNAYGLSDLFTQDIEDNGPPPQTGTPGQSDDAPKAEPRGKRQKASEVQQQIANFLSSWKGRRRDGESDYDQWAEFCYRATGETFDYKKSAEWNEDRLRFLKVAIEKEEAAFSKPTTQHGGQDELPF